MSTNGFALFSECRACIYEHLISQALTSFLLCPATPRRLPPSLTFVASREGGSLPGYLTAGSLAR